MFCSCPTAVSAVSENVRFDATSTNSRVVDEFDLSASRPRSNAARSKLAAFPERAAPRREKNADVTQLLHLYVERFNRRDWDGLRELIAADARLRVADRFVGRLVDSPYFGNYERWTVPWRMAVGEVDGEPVTHQAAARHREVDAKRHRSPRRD